MHRFYSLSSVGVLLVAVSVLAIPAHTSAGERPHSSRGTAQFLPDATGDFVGSGYATHLGNYTEVGNASISPIGEIEGWAHYTAGNGNGHTLFATFTGQVDAFGAITVTVTYVGGTGQFENASGSATLLGQIQLDGTIVVAVEGTIDY